MSVGMQDDSAFSQIVSGLNLDEVMIPKDRNAPEVQFKDIMPFKLLPDGTVTVDEDPQPFIPVEPDPTAPRLWDVRPITVTHIAGNQIVLFGRYMRQRCDWCGVVLLEYDLTHTASTDGGPPAMWPVATLVRVDAHISAEIDNPERTDEGIQLPMDSCGFDPLTQVGR